MIARQLLKRMETRMSDRKVIILYGARQVGKTTLLKNLAKRMQEGKDKFVLWLNADEPDVRAEMENITSTGWRNLLGKHTVLIIDEAQRIENIGEKLKLLADEIPKVKVIASGSSSFDLAQKTQEALTGRKWEFVLHPLSYTEAENFWGAREERRSLNQRLVYGYYPEIAMHPGDEEQRLRELSQSYLYKDVLSLGNIRKPEKLQKLLQSLAFQIGNEVSFTELGQMAELDKATIANYLDVLEKAFIIFRLPSFSRNLRNEIKKHPKIYFYDNGIRNAIIRHFQPVELRNDAGALWENFIISERRKRNDAAGFFPAMNFWRNHAGAEIDYIEEQNNVIKAFELKWNSKKKAKLPVAFAKEYSPSSFEKISTDNFIEFIH